MPKQLHNINLKTILISAKTTSTTWMNSHKLVLSHELFLSPSCKGILVWTPCIMHGCVISTMFGSCFWFFKKNFSFQTIVGPPAAPVLCIFHSGSLPRQPPCPILRISHSDSLTRRAPQPGPSHFPLRFFNPSIPPCRSFTFPTPVL
jgi:hypothetical protein